MQRRYHRIEDRDPVLLPLQSRMSCLQATRPHHYHRGTFDMHRGTAALHPPAQIKFEHVQPQISSYNAIESHSFRAPERRQLHWPACVALVILRQAAGRNADACRP